MSNTDDLDVVVSFAVTESKGVNRNIDQTHRHVNNKAQQIFMPNSKREPHANMSHPPKKGKKQKTKNGFRLKVQSFIPGSMSCQGYFSADLKT